MAIDKLQAIIANIFLMALSTCLTGAGVPPLSLVLRDVYLGFCQIFPGDLSPYPRV